MEFDKEKPTILLVHGSGLTHIVWSFHEQFYSMQGFNVLSVDLPGHGNSEGPSLKSIEEISDWIKSLMEKLNIKKIIIIGHSQGNPVKKIINSSRDIREILAVDLNACNNYKGGKESLEKINCPTLCIFGDLDKMIPLEVGNKMASMIKNSKKKVISNCGHMIIFEKALEMRKIVKEFLTK